MDFVRINAVSIDWFDRSTAADADLLAVRFPFRAEPLFDDPNDIMPTMRNAWRYPTT
jgi:hypothetical protein